MNGRSLRTTTNKADIMFALGVMVSLFLLMVESGGHPEIISVYSAATVAVIVTIGTILLTICAAFISDIERRCAEHYAYQNIANAAVIAIMASIFAHGAWQIAAINGAGIRYPLSTDVIAILILAWTAGYFILRIRGLKS